MSLSTDDKKLWHFCFLVSGWALWYRKITSIPDHTSMPSQGVYVSHITGRKTWWPPLPLPTSWIKPAVYANMVRTGLKSTWIYRTVLKSPWKLNLSGKVLEKHLKALKIPWILHNLACMNPGKSFRLKGDLTPPLSPHTNTNGDISRRPLETELMGK